MSSEVAFSLTLLRKVGIYTDGTRKYTRDFSVGWAALVWPMWYPVPLSSGWTASDVLLVLLRSAVAHEGLRLSKSDSCSSH
ncbi:hypothetical protein BDW66DRAFT_141376 [Aspergillus desertorum]